MKKLFCLILACALFACALTGCRKSASPAEDTLPGQVAPGAPQVMEVPDEGYHGEQDQSAALEQMPTLAPPEPVEGAEGEAVTDAQSDYYSIDALINGTDGEAAEPEPQPEATVAPEPAPEAPASTDRPAVDTSTYQYSALTDTSLGFTFNYPSHWENVPGVYTVCFREKVEPGDFPARVAITVKSLVHSPDEQAITDQLTSYMRIVRAQYEAKTFEAGTPNSEDTFLGQLAMSNTYLAYSGKNEVKGFIIGTAVGRRMYVFHFCATYEDYAPMESMMRYMVKSAELVDRDN